MLLLLTMRKPCRGPDADTAPGTGGTSPAPASPKHNPMNSSLALLGLPSTAEWVLLVSKSSIRLYPAPAAIAGNKRPTEDIKLDFEIDSAAVVAVPSQKPMLVGWSAVKGLQVRRSAWARHTTCGIQSNTVLVP